MGVRDYIHVVCPPLWEKLPPTGAAYLAEFIEHHGWSFHFYDLNLAIHQRVSPVYRKEWTVNRDFTQESFFFECLKLYPDVFEGLVHAIQAVRPSAVGFSVYSSNREFVIGLISFIRQKFPGLRLFVGGPETFALDVTGRLERLAVDAVVVGEGERALLELLEGRINTPVVRFQEIPTLDFFPKYKGFDLKSYPRQHGLSIVASRGCIYRCKFCSERLLYQGFRLRTPNSLMEEITYHVMNHQIRWFTFHDSLFNADFNRLSTFLDLLLASGLNIQWDAQIAVRPDMSLDLLFKMRKSGCINLFIGMESGSASLLSKMNKRFKPDDAVVFFSNLKEAGLNYEISLIAHYPGESVAEFEETLVFLRNNVSLIPKVAQISLYRSYPGTDVTIPSDYKESDGQGKLERLLSLLDELKIRYTRSYINNLI